MTQILVHGTISQWQWNGSNFFEGAAIDPGIFGPSGASLTGDAISVLWDTDATTATVTVNGITVTLGPSPAYYFITENTQTITVIPGDIAITDYAPGLAAANPHGIGGTLALLGPHGGHLNAYFFTDYMGPTVPVPAPLLGESLLGAAILCLVLLKINRRRCVDFC